MKAKTKDKLFAWICVIAIALAIGGFIGGIFGIEASHDKNSKSPLRWCVLEITTHDGYDEADYSFTYEIPNPPEGEQMEPNTYCYVITMHTEEKVGVWYCFIECVCNHVMYKTLHINGSELRYQPNEVKSIDCDLGYEIMVGKDIQYE